jgi:porphobilinogen synthase
MLDPQTLTPADLSMVLLVTAEQVDRAMKTVTTAEIPAIVRECDAPGIRSVKLFAESTQRNATGEQSVAHDWLMARVIDAAKQAAPGVAVMTETCLCSYTDDGACYLSDRDGHPNVAATLDVTVRQAVAHAVAGADIVGPASMVLGTTGGARRALNETGHEGVSVMPHVIFWSSLYDGFRVTMGATPKAGINREFQVNPTRPDQFIDAAMRMEADGADMLPLEPAIYCADVLTTLKSLTSAPLFPFSVSGDRRSPPGWTRLPRRGEQRHPRRFTPRPSAVSTPPDRPARRRGRPDSRSSHPRSRTAVPTS